MIELDKRIIEGKKPLTAFDEVDSKFIGTDCYFSDDASDFMDVSKHCQKGRLLSIGEVTGLFNATKNNSYAVFTYCLPCEWVNMKEPEKKYRPFLLNEFLNRYRLGNTVYFRRIGYKEVKCAMFVEYVRGESPEENQITLGNMRYTLAYLFKNHELSLEDIWQPFGVEE